MKLREARVIAGTLGKPSKMPGSSYGIPAKACLLGAKLAKLKGSTCSKCYALKGRYLFDHVAKAQSKRLGSLDHPQWVEAMVTLLRHYHAAGRPRTGYHRWHDSGDLQSIEHLQAICEVAKATPGVKHWLPTREIGIVRQLRADPPKNLVIRISAMYVDQDPPTGFSQTSTVHKTGKPIGRACPAPGQGNQCGSCRACWDPRVKNVSYREH